MVRKTRFLSKVAIASVILALLVIAIAYAATVNIDSFDIGTQDLSVYSGKTTDSNALDTTASIGGERDVYLAWVSGDAGIELHVDQYGTTNRLAFAAADGMKGTANVTWDGDDNDATSLDATGLGGKDLTDNNTNDAIRAKIVFDDRKTQLTFKIYTDSNNWSQLSVNLPGGIDDTSNWVDILFPFDSFGNGAGTTNFANVGAIVLEIDGTIESALDLSIDLVESTSVREYGDLPDEKYAASILSANHIPKGLRLGNNVDTEASYPTTGDADADDDTDFDDEDGVTRVGPQWTGGADGGQVQVVIEGCAVAGGCYVNGWIDWNNDGDFGDTDVGGASEHIVNNVHETTDGTKTYTIDVPKDGVANGTYYARFRICEGSTDCDNPDNTDTNVSNGEVEDYKWSFGPNAVTLTHLKATSVPSRQPVGAAAAALALLASGMVVGGVLVLRRRSRLP